MSWHQIDCLATTVHERGIARRYERTGFRRGLIDGRVVRVSFVPSSNRWIVTR